MGQSNLGVGVTAAFPPAAPASPAPAPSAEPKAPLSVGGRVKCPRILQQVDPSYRVLARRALVQGDVVISDHRCSRQRHRNKTRLRPPTADRSRHERAQELEVRAHDPRRRGSCHLLGRHHPFPSKLSPQPARRSAAVGLQSLRSAAIAHRLRLLPHECSR
jgi:hypothetical protein